MLLAAGAAALHLRVHEAALVGEPVIPTGYEDLAAEILGSGEQIAGSCQLIGGGVDYAIRGVYQCGDDKVVIELIHPSKAPPSAVHTARFAVMVQGSPPPGFLDALIARVRAREEPFQWTILPPSVPVEPRPPFNPRPYAIGLVVALSLWRGRRWVARSLASMQKFSMIASEKARAAVVPVVSAVGRFWSALRHWRGENRVPVAHGRWASARRRGGGLIALAVALFAINFAVGAYLKNRRNGLAQWNAILAAQASAPAAHDGSGTPGFFREIVAGFSDSVIYPPFVMWAMDGLRGRYLNIERRRRQTTAPPAGLGPCKKVFFLGGSTMFGHGAADDETIPSYVVQHAAQDGVCVAATNLGMPMYVSFGELIRLEEVLVEGDVPDVVVFYDGWNDFITAPERPAPYLRSGQRKGDSPIYMILEAEYDHHLERWGDLRDVLEDNSALFWLTSGNVRLFGGRQPESDHSDQAALDRLVKNMTGTARLARALAPDYGFKVMSFVQPTIWTRKTPSDFERTQFDPAEVEPYRRFREIMVRDGFIDLGGALDGVPATTSLYLDQGHMAGPGNSLVARAIWQHLRPALVP